MTVAEETTESFKESEQGLLPEDWGIIKFIDSIVKERRIIPDSILQSEYKHIGKYPIVDQSIHFIAGYTDDENKVLINPLPVIIFGDHTRIFKYIDFPFAIGADGTKLIFPKKDILEPKFLYFYFLNLDIPSKGYNRHFKFLKEKYILLPPLTEQQKMASVLSTIQEAKEKTGNVLRATKELKKSMMKHLFTYGPVPLEDAEKVPLRKTEIGMIPEHWEVKETGEIVRDKIKDGVHKTPKYLDEGIPFITAKDIINNRISFRECRYISDKEHNQLIKRVNPEKGDILLTKVGTVGNVALIEDEPEFSIFVQIALIKPNVSIVFPSYLKYCIASGIVQKEISDKSAQSTMKFIGVQRIAKLCMPIPPNHEQQQIANILTSVDSKIEAAENKKQALDTLFKTLLSLLMTGKLRVKDLEIPA